MNRASAGWLVASVVVVSALLTAVSVRAQQDPPEKQAGVLEAAGTAKAIGKGETVLTDEQIRAALQKPVEAAIDTKLHLAIDHFRTQAAVPVYVNWVALAEAGVERTHRIAMNLDGVTAETVLHAILEQITAAAVEPICYQVDGGFLRIDTRSQLRSIVETRVYDITDLILRMTYQPPSGGMAVTLSLDLPAPAGVALAYWVERQSELEQSEIASKRESSVLKDRLAKVNDRIRLINEMNMQKSTAAGFEACMVPEQLVMKGTQNVGVQLAILKATRERLHAAWTTRIEQLKTAQAEVASNEEKSLASLLVSAQRQHQFDLGRIQSLIDLVQQHVDLIESRAGANPEFVQVTGGDALIFVPVRKQRVTRVQAVEETVAIIHDTVGDPDDWRQLGGKSDMREMDGRLIVRTTKDNHRELAELLEWFRKGGASRPAVNIPASGAGAHH